MSGEAGARTLSTLGYSQTERTARREHYCLDCGRLIFVGQRYIDLVAAPRYDFNPNPGHWTRAAVCIRPDPQ